MGSISASEANRNFSALLRRVQQGETMSITSRGRVVAEIAPPRVDKEARAEALRALLQRLRSQPPVVVGPFDRASLYEDEPE